jgi:phosphate-selective porin OprO and OprP
MRMKPSFIAVALSGLLLGSRAASAQEPPAVPSDPTLAAPPAGAPPNADAPPPAAPTPAPVVAPPPVPMAPPPPAPVAEEPLAGVSNGTMFLRSPDNLFVFFPNGRLQMDGYFYKTSNAGEPKNTFLLKRARLELAGWIDNIAYFQIGADFATGAPVLATNPGANGAANATNAPISQTNLNTTDNFVAIAPWEDLAILQFGQFDAPFTLENRTSDKYFDFLERSFTVRAFGIPSNKEQGFMLHGTNADRNYYYSGAVLNGDGQNYKNVDGNFDLMARGWIAPASFMGAGPLHDITVGGSYWTGNRTYGLPLANQTTAGGFVVLNTGLPKLGTDLQGLNQQGRQHTWALEVNAPIDHKFGARWEYVHKDQPLSAIDTTMSTTANEVITAGLHLKGWSTYVEAWAWVMGDDRIIGEPGMQMPTRYKKFGVKPPQHGLMIAARLEFLNETLSADDSMGALSGLAVGGLGQTKLTSFTLGANYWISKRFRTSFNWNLNDFGGDTSNAKKLKNENEFSFRLAIAL